jgi:hypothetical protein
MVNKICLSVYILLLIFQMWKWYIF